jgi:uncharacterized ion transporter superfamily protein YfcC
MRTPDALLIVFVLAVAAFLATFFVTPGRFEVATPEGGGRAQVVAGTYVAAEGPSPAPLLWGEDRAGLAGFLFEGLVSGDRYSATVGLMAFIFVIGGAFGIILRLGSVDRALLGVLRTGSGETSGVSDLVPVALFVAMSACGAVFGMSEEAIVLSLIVVPALLKSGYDSLTALVCTYVSCQIGFGTSWMNPFSVIIAQGISGLAPMSGLWLRVAIWAAFTAVGAVALWRYARFIRRNPERSLAFASDTRLRASYAASGDSGGRLTGTMSVADWLVLLAVLAGVTWVGWGVTTQGYYLAEMAGQFFVIGLIAAVIGRVFRLNGVDSNALVSAFRDGAVQMTPAILVVGAAKGIVALLGGDNPAVDSVLNTALQGASVLTALLPDWATAWGMYTIQSAINLVVVSGSGQAALTMPLMAPLADLSGVSRQTAVLAFQLGDGMTNLITPASAALMGCLAAARLDWVTWVRFIWRPLLVLMAACSASVLIAHGIGYA